jgi:cytochrome P450
MASPIQGSKSAIPDHVPPHLIYEFDYIGDPAILAQPHERMKQIAAEAPPLFYTPYYGGHWVARSRQVLEQITLHPDVFSNHSRGIPRMETQPVLIPLTFDPPEHTTYRMPLNKHFSAKAVARLSENIHTMSNGLIDAVIEQGGCNFLHDIAEPLPVILFMQMAGMPTDRLKEFRLLAEQATAAPDPAIRQSAFGRIAEILSEVITARMAEPRDDLISHLIAADLDGRKPSFEELRSYAVILFLGGLETVVNAISFSILHLAQDPSLQSELRAAPEKLPQAIEEFLRLYGIAMSVRRVTRDTEIAGAIVKEDESILLLIPAVNYDAEAFATPTAFCPHRKEQHVTFNMGPHRCIGANLARLELKIFLTEWLRRVPRFRLDTTKPPSFIGGLNLAVQSLDLKWD